MDYYDNIEPIFEDLFCSLAKKGVNVQWTNDTERYYADMNDLVDKNKIKNE